MGSLVFYRKMVNGSGEFLSETRNEVGLRKRWGSTKLLQREEMNSNREMAIGFSPEMEMDTSSCGFVMLDGERDGDNVKIREKVRCSLRLGEKDGGGVQERLGATSSSLPSSLRSLFQALSKACFELIKASMLNVVLGIFPPPRKTY